MESPLLEEGREATEASEAGVLAEEEASTRRRRMSLGLGPASRDGIGLCFSGGGVRAASFDCGVLWRLAEIGILKEVDHISAVSGGAYAASAFISHLDDVQDDAGYRLVCARLISRMQDNIGYIVTTGHSVLRPRDGPRRVWDIPHFALLLVGMPLANVATFVAFWALPLVSWINLNHGHSMRARICGKKSSLIAPYISVLMGVVAFVVFCVASLGLAMKCFSKRWWLNATAVQVAGSRLFLIALTYVVLIAVAQASEGFDYGNSNNRIAMRCSCQEFYAHNVTFGNNATLTDDCSRAANLPPLTPVGQRSFAAACLVFFGCVLGFASLCALLGAPSLLGLSGRLMGPLTGIFGVSYITQWRVFGPLTNQRLLPGCLVYNSRLWSSSLVFFSVLAILRIPSSHELPRMLHRFYASCLRQAFFAEGKDPEMTDDVPNLILGCTVNEFRRPESKRTAMPFVITQRAWGGSHTGHAKVPQWLSLSRATAISGAAIDGLVLTTFKSKALRLGLQVLNLRMGDTVPFSTTGEEQVGACLSVAVNSARALDVCSASSKKKLRPDSLLSSDELATTWHIRRWEMALFCLVYSAFAASGALESSDDRTLPTGRNPSALLAAIGSGLLFVFVLASAWTHSDRLRWLMSSPIINQVHILLNVLHYSTRTPPTLTLTDGGLVECTGVVELLRRRQRWIVLVDTTEDPLLKFRYLRDGLKQAQDDRLIGEIPALEEVLNSYHTGAPIERLKAAYPDGRPCDIFLIKMRPSPTGCDERCAPLISSLEVAPDAKPEALPQSKIDLTQQTPKLSQRQINGVCCEWTHHLVCPRRSCKPCGVFPFLSVGNQFLTPLQFANLCRLARDLADEPLKALVDARQCNAPQVVASRPNAELPLNNQ